MKLSILILTHNRPELFKRCIQSVLKNKPENVEILVNNDSNDIEELDGATYFYSRSEDISDLYKFLFDKAKGELIWFLEDDDYAVKKVYEHIFVDKNTIFRYIPFTGINDYIDFWNRNTFDYNFQLSQMVFRKEDLTEFPTLNNLQNDLKIYKTVNSNNQFKHINIPIYYQTTDGKDNISFYQFNKDKRFNIGTTYR